MIDTQWLRNISNIVIEYTNENSIFCKLDERSVKIEFNKFEDGTYDTNMHFIEDGIYLFHFWIDKLELETIKELFIKWIVNKNAIDSFAQNNKNIRTEEIYNYYLKGEDAMIRYYWDVIKSRLKARSSDEIINLFDLCSNSQVLKNFIPYISVGRVCLSNTSVRESFSIDCQCINFFQGKYEVANYQHENLQLFDTAPDAISYIEKLFREKNNLI